MEYVSDSDSDMELEVIADYLDVEERHFRQRERLYFPPHFTSNQ